jgi:hypothetical protein
MMHISCFFSHIFVNNLTFLGVAQSVNFPQ